MFMKPLLYIISLLFGFLNTAGISMHLTDSLTLIPGIKGILLFVLLMVVFSVLFYIAAYWLLKGFNHMAAEKGSCTDRFIERHIFIFSFCFILIFWLPWVITYYPASMDWDVYRQLSSYLGIWARSNHDPWLSSCVLGVCYQIGVKLGSENLGIFIFVVIRDVLMALIYAECVSMLKKAGLKRIIYFGVLLFYAVTPVWGAYAKHAFKDTFCTALFVWYIMNTIVLIFYGKAGKLKNKHWILYGISALVLSLFRNNCVYVAAPATLLVIIFLIAKRQKLYYSIGIAALLSVYFIFNSFIVNYMGVIPASSKEALAIPFQQTARTVKYHYNTITDEERELIGQVLDYESMPERYDPLISDPIKDNWNGDATGEDLKNYFIVWAKMFFKYPVTYLEAAIGQSYGYYAFNNGFAYGAGNYNSGMTIFDWIEVDAFKEYFSFHYIEAMETGRQLLNHWANLWDKIPVLNLTNKIALYTWIIVLIGFELLRKKQISELIPVVALLIMICTCIASPVNGCFRYFAPVAASMPALFIFFGRNDGKL